MVEVALTSSPVWRAKQAWLCIGVTQLIVAATVMASLLLNLNTAAMSSSARAGLGVITSGLVLWIGIQFSEVSSAREFQQRFGVVACRSEYIAIGIFAGMILQLGPRALVVGG